MKSLKQIINRYIRSAAIVMALVILVVIAFAEILIEQGRVEDTAAGTFVRLEQMAFLRRCLRINPCSLCRMPARTPLRAKTCSIPPCRAHFGSGYRRYLRRGDDRP